jgi:hypothetical protein
MARRAGAGAGHGTFRSQNIYCNADFSSFRRRTHLNFLPAVTFDPSNHQMQDTKPTQAFEVGRCRHGFATGAVVWLAAHRVEVTNCVPLGNSGTLSCFANLDDPGIRDGK